MRFVIDGDGCPVKNEIISLGKEFNVPVLIVTSVDHFTTKEYPDHVSFIYVDKGNDGADYRIVKETQHQDIIVTQDYGLASLLIGKQVRIFHHSGKEYLPETMDTLLAQRHIHAQIRKAGKKTKGPKAFTQEDREMFVNIMKQKIRENF